MADQAEEYKQHIEKLMDTVRPMNEYKEDFASHCRKSGPRISTGLLALDKALNGGLANELYIMGAETSTGKSAFMMSIAQKVAEAGTDVLYFALEMGRDEFVARGISSISFEHHRENEQARRVTAANILYWTYDNILCEFSKMAYSIYEKYADEYFSRYGAHLHIIESGISGLTVKDIANIAAKYKMKSQKPVAVFIDYMQIIKADPCDRTQSDRKTKTDIVVTTLKTLASQIGMPVVTISSIGRMSYNGRISTASFKESGDTEYTGGVLLGWNWNGVTNETDDEKRDAEKKLCKERGFRKMSLEVLKYRNAERDNAVQLKYYPAYNYFEEYSDSENGSESTQSSFSGSQTKPIVRG
jgi:replicative DNA helicase